MSGLFVQITAATISTTLTLHLIVVSVQVGFAVNDGIRLRAIPELPFLAALWQNVGIGLALIGFLQRDTQLIIFGGLFLGLRLALLPLGAPSWNEHMERALLALAAVSMILLSALHSLPHIAD